MGLFGSLCLPLMKAWHILYSSIQRIYCQNKILENINMKCGDSVVMFCTWEGPNSLSAAHSLSFVSLNDSSQLTNSILTRRYLSGKYVFQELSAYASWNPKRGTKRWCKMTWLTVSLFPETCERVLKLGTIDGIGDPTLYLHFIVSAQIYRWQLWWYL